MEVSAKHLKCMQCQLTVDTYVDRYPSLLCMPEPFLWDFASLLNASHGNRVTGSFAHFVFARVAYFKFVTIGPMKHLISPRHNP